MRVLLDENMSSRRLAARLQSAGHIAVLANDVGLVSVADARVLIWAVAHACPVLTRDHEDFTALHDPVSVWAVTTRESWSFTSTMTHGTT